MNLKDILGKVRQKMMPNGRITDLFVSGIRWVGQQLLSMDEAAEYCDSLPMKKFLKQYGISAEMMGRKNLMRVKLRDGNTIEMRVVSGPDRDA